MSLVATVANSDISKALIVFVLGTIVSLHHLKIVWTCASTALPVLRRLGFGFYETVAEFLTVIPLGSAFVADSVSALLVPAFAVIWFMVSCSLLVSAKDLLVVAFVAFPDVRYGHCVSLIRYSLRFEVISCLSTGRACLIERYGGASVLRTLPDRGLKLRWWCR